MVNVFGGWFRGVIVGRFAEEGSFKGKVVVIIWLKGGGVFCRHCGRCCCCLLLRVAGSWREGLEDYGRESMRYKTIEHTPQNFYHRNVAMSFVSLSMARFLRTWGETL